MAGYLFVNPLGNFSRDNILENGLHLGDSSNSTFRRNCVIACDNLFKVVVYQNSDNNYVVSLATQTMSNTYVTSTDYPSISQQRTSLITSNFYCNSRFLDLLNPPDTIPRYNSQDSAISAMNDGNWSPVSSYPITYRPTNCSFPNAPTEAVVGDTVVVPVTFPDGYGLVNESNIYVTNNGVVVPSTYSNGQLTFTMPDPS